MASFAVAQMNAVARVSSAASTVRAQAAPVRLAALNRSTTLAGLVNKSRHNLVARTARLTVRAADTDTEVVETAATDAATDAAPAPAKKERGERGAVGAPRARGGGRPKREITVNFDDIAVGNIYKGTVASVQAYGAFINFGAKSDGLVHISELTDGFVADVGEVLTQGQAVDVRIISVDVAAGRVSLSMRTEEAEVVTTGPAATGEVELDEMGKPIRQGKVATRSKKAAGRDRKAAPPVKKGEKYQAIVKTITGFGAFVELKIEGVEGVEGLVHISQLSEGIVSTVESVVSVGQEVSVRVQSVDGSKLSLTMKEEFDIAALNAASGAATGPSFSVLELALKNAGVSRDMFAEQPNAPKAAVVAAVAEAVAAPVEEAPAPVEATPVVAAAEAVPAPAADAAPPASGTVSVSASMVKALRQVSGAGMMDCKKALIECGGDVEKASESLRKKGIAGADKKASRIAAEGGVGSYIHMGSSIGVLVEINCETDFVAKGDIFKSIVADIAMQIAANPTVEYVSTADIPAEIVTKEKEIEMGKEDLASKPVNIREKMVEGRIAKLLKEKALLEQPFIKDSDKTVDLYIKECIATIGEKISIRRFARYNLGEGLQKKEENFAEEIAKQTQVKAAEPKAEEKKEEKKEEPAAEEKPKFAVSAAMVKELRGLSAAGMMDCKKALAECSGDVEKASEWLRKKGIAGADKKASRIAADGNVGSYIHMGSTIGVLVEINCETDFVAKGDIFKSIVADIAMQIAANPTVEYVSTADIPAEIVAKEKEIEMGKEDLASKPVNIREKMVEGRIAKLLKEKALLEQPFIKDSDKTVDTYIKEKIATIGEKISIRRFTRFNLGEGLEKKNEDFAAEVAAQTQKKN